MKKHPILTTILGLIVLLAEILPVFAQQDDSFESILISEIQIAGSTSTDEFIELYNPTSGDIDISSWSIQYKSSSGSKYYKKNFEDDMVVPKKGFFLIAHNDFSGDVASDMQHSSFSLASSGNVYLVAGQNTLDGNDFSLAVDSVSWQDLEAGVSLERQDYTGDFFLQENPNPENTVGAGFNPPIEDDAIEEDQNLQEENIDIEVDEPETNAQNESIEDEEIVESEIDTEDEVVQEETSTEIDTNVVVTEDTAPEEPVGTDHDLSLEDEVIEDDEESQTEGTQEIEQPETVDTEKDTEDEVVQEETSTEIDTDVVVTEDTALEDFVGAGPASVSSDDETTADEFNPPSEDIDDTPDNNIQTASSSGQGLEDDKEDGEIVLTELFPNPKNEEDEYIEIQNIGDFSVNIAGWVVSDQSTSFKISEEDFLNLTVQSGQYLIIPHSLSAISLNNTGDSVYLFNASGLLKDIVSYGSASEGKSYSRNDSNVWEWSNTQSPGSKNVSDPENHAPVAKMKINGAFVQGQEISFDASESLDEDNDVLLYIWTFGDGMSASKETLLKIYTTSGTYIMSLTVYDSAGASNTVSYTLDIASSQEEQKGEVMVEENREENNISKTSYQSITATTSSDQGIIQDVIISAALPNPAGDDTAEWIELYNSGTTDVDISSWQIDDEDGGSAVFLIPQGTVLPAGMFMVFSKDDTDISFNNSQDELRLFDDSGRLLQSVFYEDAEEERALVYYDGKYVWQGSPVDTTYAQYFVVSNDSDTASIHTIQTTDATISSSDSSTDFSEEVVLAQEIEMPEKDLSISSVNGSQIISVADVKALQPGASVLVQAVVIALPGVFGSQYFYIQDSTGGIQVYQHKKDFPLLTLGDVVLVDGEISISQGEFRIKTKSQENIQRVSENSTLSQPVHLAQFSPKHVGMLVTVSGSVIEQKKDILYMQALNTELPVILKAKGISYKDIQATSGDDVEATGILFLDEDGYFLKPREMIDIHITPVNTLNETSQENVPDTVDQKEDFSKDEQEKDIAFVTKTSTLSWWHMVILICIFLIFFSLLAWEYVKRKKKGRQ